MYNIKHIKSHFEQMTYTWRRKHQNGDCIQHRSISSVIVIRFLAVLPQTDQDQTTTGSVASYDYPSDRFYRNHLDEAFQDVKPLSAYILGSVVGGGGGVDKIHSV